MLLKELIIEEDKFQTFLNTKNDYTVIAPVDGEEFKKFIKLANDHIDGYTIHQVLKNKEQIRTLLMTLNSNTELAVYVVDDRMDQMILRATTDEYIDRFSGGFIKL
jgi:hypothetical protein